MYTKNPDWQDLLIVLFLFFFHENHSICSQSHRKECSQAFLALTFLPQKKKKRTVVPRHLTNHAHKAERGSVPRVEQGRPC